MEVFFILTNTNLVSCWSRLCDRYCIRHIFREGFIFANFTNRVLRTRTKLTTRFEKKNLPPIPTHECNLHTQCTCKAHDITSHILTSPFIALFDREFNHSRKCLKVLIREKLDSQNIWLIYSTQATWNE